MGQYKAELFVTHGRVPSESTNQGAKIREEKKWLGVTLKSHWSTVVVTKTWLYTGYCGRQSSSVGSNYFLHKCSMQSVIFPLQNYKMKINLYKQCVEAHDENCFFCYHLFIFYDSVLFNVVVIAQCGHFPTGILRDIHMYNRHERTHTSAEQNLSS